VPVGVDFWPEALSVTSGRFLRLSTVLRPSVSCSSASSRFALPRWAALVACGWLAGSVAAADSAVDSSFKSKIEPILEKYCYDCHGNGVDKGSITLDEFESAGDLRSKHDLWLKVLKNVRGGLMPPREEDEILRPTPAEVETLANWIKYEAFATDPKNPDPGRVTARRLNRVEYRNTIRDLMGYDFNSEVEFPTDDTGHGFDNIGDVLTISPLHLEKYLSAAETIVDKAVPKVARIIRERSASGREFRAEGGGGNGEQLNARRALKVSRTFNVEHAEKYQLVVEFEVRGSFDFDPSRCRLICRVDGEERFVEEVAWSERRTIRKEYEVDWKAGSHVVAFEVVPLPPVDRAEPAAAGKSGAGQSPKAGGAQPSPTSVSMRINTVQVRGPLNPQHWIAPDNYDRFFPHGPAPEDPAARDAQAADVLRRFATKAFRRPVEASRLQRLVDIAKDVYSTPGATFEQGIGRAMMAVLGSPRFIFRVEQPDAASAADRYALIDEYALASRLSYFLWSSMPDDELFRLAGRGELRRELRPQLARMLKDPKSQAFVRNFTGQWLQARDVEFVPINARVALGPNAPRNRDGRIEFDSAFRKLMRSETEMYFEHLLREDRSVLDLVDSDYTFLNERLAQHYGVPGVTGENMRLVKLPPDSPRGGVITQGTVLAVTSNPTRTSPVKRGLFILENILGTPPPPAPPNVPDLEEARKDFKDRDPKLSEMLAVHRANPMCSSCHQRMDPLGLALENFNALGGWRDTDARQPIEPGGHLVTGEKFADVRELKRILRNERKMDVYQCLTEKLMTYALGRGVEYYDVHTIDEIAARLDREGGRISVLLTSIVESPAFQRQRRDPSSPAISLQTPN
jgi:hypothetical protein